MIHDHQSARLSALDAEVVRAVPPGGNWRNLPLDFASKRIEQIRRSAAAGEGSRSTYYGRLRWDAPAYTISTYFNRPGNGCFIHPSQPRLITVREAARLQAFPDSYRFVGAGRAKFIQVGNAVPPLLAYQLAAVYEAGSLVDLFCGAGGLSLGFEWAGHELVAAIDNDTNAIQTFQENRPNASGIDDVDLSTPEGHARTMFKIRSRVRGGLDLLVGGPPCQGFSTAGNNQRDDPRNMLVFAFLRSVEELRPRRVIIENVPALMWRGRSGTLAAIRRELYNMGYESSTAILHAEGYGIPQLRRRLFIAASRSGPSSWPIPSRTILHPAYLAHQPGSNGAGIREGSAVTVRDAITDLPELPADASVAAAYPGPALTEYQRWARGEASAATLVPPKPPYEEAPTLFSVAVT